MSSICKNNFSISLVILGLYLIDFWKIPKRQMLANFNFNNFLWFTKINMHFSVWKLLFNVTVSIPYRFITDLFIINCTIFTSNPNLIPSFLKFSNSFLSTLLLTTNNMIGSNTTMSTIWLYYFRFWFFTILFDYFFSLNI